MRFDGEIDCIACGVVHVVAKCLAQHASSSHAQTGSNQGSRLSAESEKDPRAQHRRCGLDRSHQAGVTLIKIGCRTAIGHALPGERRPCQAVAVLDARCRVVPDLMTGLIEPPEEVNIFAKAKCLVETLQGFKGVAANK